MSVHHPHFWLQTAQSRLQDGNPSQAAEALQTAIVLAPEAADAHLSLARLLWSPETVPEPAVLVLLERATRLAPDWPPPWLLLSLALRQLHRPAEALLPAARFCALAADATEAIRNLAEITTISERYPESLLLYQRLVTLAPADSDGWTGLANAALRHGDDQQAHAAFVCALTLTPGRRDAWLNRGAVAFRHNALREAVQCFQQALALDPHHAESWVNLGAVALQKPDPGLAAFCLQTALSLAPALAQAWSCLGVVFHRCADAKAAAFLCRRAAELEPADTSAFSNALLAWQAVPGVSAAFLADEHRRFGRGFPPPPPRRPPVPRAPEPLRLGIVSGDLRSHPVACFLEPVLRHLDRQRFLPIAYAEVVDSDSGVGPIRALFAGWHSTTGWPDARLAARIAADGIDILMDLSGHTERNRLPLFARRPAPVTASWLGYPDTTGLAAMDYRIVDPLTDPTPVADALSCEALVRLEEGFLCHPCPDDAPPVAVRPDDAPPTFGSFATLSKLNPPLLALWAAILHAVPHARLVLKSGFLAVPQARSNTIDRLVAAGIAPERITALTHVNPRPAHLADYGAMDIALDTFPYAGTTTTLEALWMGVPVVTLAGDRHAARVGASLLQRAGLEQLVTASPAAYLQQAVALANALPQCRAARPTIRARLAASPLADAPGFTRALEAALLAMWARHQAGLPPTPFSVRRTGAKS